MNRIRVSSGDHARERAARRVYAEGCASDLIRGYGPLEAERRFEFVLRVIYPLADFERGRRAPK